MSQRLHRLFALAALGCAAAAPARASRYDEAVLAAKPVLYLTMAGGATGREPDLSGRGAEGVYTGTPGSAALPNGDAAADFDGDGQYLSVPSLPALSPTASGALTIESWIKPSVLDFPRTESEGYVYWLGKGNGRDGYEYANRMYSRENPAKRPNRVSVYAWNPKGGLGSGAYFQDPIEAGRWMFVTDVIDLKTRTIAIFRDGALRGRVPLSQYKVTPRATGAPFTVGTRGGQSWFQGAVGKVAVFGRALSEEEIHEHYRAMVGRD